MAPTESTPHFHPPRILERNTMTLQESTTTVAHFVPENLPTHLQHYIEGKFVDSVGGETFEVLEPVFNQTYATAAAG